MLHTAAAGLFVTTCSVTSMQNTLSEHVTRLNTAKYYVTHHITYGDVKGNIYASEGEALARFAELDGGNLAAAVWDESLRELKYYGARGQRPAEMMEWARERPDPAGY